MEIMQLKETLSAVSSELTLIRLSRPIRNATVLSDPLSSYAAATAATQGQRPPRTQTQQHKTVKTSTGTRASAARPAKSVEAATDTRVQGSKSLRKVAVVPGKQAVCCLYHSEVNYSQCVICIR